MSEAHRTLPPEIEGQFRYSEGWFRTFIDVIFGRLGFLGDGAELRRELFARFDSADTFRLFPETRAVVKRLKGAGIPIGVVSNWSARLPALMRALELEDAFDFVLCSAIEGLEKPEPALFERALARAGSAPERTLHAGDHPAKDGAAAALGLQFVLVDHRGRHAESGAERVGDLIELLELVRGRAA